MENSLKQRIIGAIVLVALAVIFLPAILKEKTSNGPFVSKIPEKPTELQEYQVDTQKIDDLLAEEPKTTPNEVVTNKESNALNPSQQNSKPSTENKKDESEVNASKALKENTKVAVSSRKTKLKTTNGKTLTNNEETSQLEAETTTISEKYIDAAWVIQVASFSNEINAVNLVNKLKKQKFKAYKRRSSIDNKQIYRVLVGPFMEKVAAEKSLSPVILLSESSAIIRVFDPINH